MFNLPLPQLKEEIQQEANISEEELKQKIEDKLDELSGLVSEEGATHIVANDLGIEINKETPVKIENLEEEMRDITIHGKVLQTYEINEFESDRGSGKVANLLIGDETGITRLTLWHDQADKIKEINEDDILEIKSAYTRKNNDQIEVHLNEKSTIQINPSGITIEEVADSNNTNNRSEPEKKDVEELTEGEQNAEITATIVDVFDLRFFDVCPQCNNRVYEEENEYKCDEHDTVIPDKSYVLNVLADDGTDSINIVFWKSQTERLLDEDETNIKEYEDQSEEFEKTKRTMIGDQVRVIGRVSKNQMFDRLEFHAQRVHEPEENEDDEEEPIIS